MVIQPQHRGIWNYRDATRRKIRAEPMTLTMEFLAEMATIVHAESSDRNSAPSRDEF